MRRLIPCKFGSGSVCHSSSPAALHTYVRAPRQLHRVHRVHTAASSQLDGLEGLEQPQVDDAFEQLVRLAVAKDPSLARPAQQHLKPVTATSSLLGPPLSSLPNQSKPPWLRQRAPQGARYEELKKQLHGLKLATVCEEAQCPNIGQVLVFAFFI